MSRLFRPAFGLTRSEFHRAADSARSFTTSQFFGADDGGSRPNFEQRSERTSKDISAMLNKVPSAGAARGARGSASGPAGAGRGRVVGLQSLPRRGNGGSGFFRGLNRGRGGTGTGMRGNGMRGPGGFRGRGQGQGQGRGGGGARGRGGGMRRKKEDAERRSDSEFAARKEAKSKINKDPETAEERAARLERETGVETRYAPTTSIESLGPYLPEVPAGSNPLGRMAAAMTSMRVLAGGHVDSHPVIHAKDMYRQFKRDGAMFFTDLRARRALEGRGEVGDAEQAIRDTITRRVVMGEHEDVVSAELKDAAGVARNALLRGGSYPGGKMTAFEGKLAELVAKGKARPAAQPKKEVKGKAEQPKGKGGKKGKVSA